MTLEDAATTLGKSLRTIQRWVASGRLETEERDGRTMVLVECPPPAGEALAQLQRQADDTGRVAALAAVTGERAALAYHERAEELERRVHEARAATRGWRVAACVALATSVATGVALAWALADSGATRDTLSDIRTRLERAEDARERLETALVDATRHDTVARFVAAEAWDECP